MSKTLSDITRVRRRFQRSIRLGDDAGAAAGFICTATAAQALKTTIEHVSGLGHGAFTWTGPYGCGKSSLAVVLAAVLGPDGPDRDEALKVLPLQLREQIMEDLRWAPQGWSTISIVGSRADTAAVITAALDEAGIKKGNSPIERLVAEAKRGIGTLLVIDEMGKLLEHAASEGGDAFFFQELAEAASRSDGRLVVVGVLHQAFDDYAYRLARETREDWLKIQGRYVDVPLNPTGEEQIELLSRAIECDARPQAIAGIADVAKAMGGTRGGAEAVEQRLASCWPLGPVVACLLGPLSRRRFGQNQRSLFGFLGSAEPYGFQDFLSSTSATEGTTYDCDWLWGYLRANLEPSIMASPDSHRWSLALDAIERSEAGGASDAELSVLRAVALLDLFRDRSGLVASNKVLASALPKLSEHEISVALEELKRRSVVIYRRHLGGFTLYAGSDFDVEQAIEDALGEIVGCDFSKLRGSGVLAPILAKREYHETGAMHWFEVDIATLADGSKRISGFQEGKGSSGLFLLLVNEDGESPGQVRRILDGLENEVGDRPIALGLSSDSYMLRELSRELIALERVQVSRPELKGDAVARREVASRLVRVAGELEDRVRHSFSTISWRIPALPSDAAASTGRAKDLSVIASRLAAELYSNAPRIRNELVNRMKPSSNAVAATRALMNAMITAPDEPSLGIQKYPPEKGLYVSLLGSTGLHAEDQAGSWSLREPTAAAGNLDALWEEADRLVEGAGTEGVGLDRLFEIWRVRPFGTKDGLLPILGLAYLLTRREKLALYLDDGFCSDISDLFVDRLLQDASSIRLRYSEISERDAAILRAVASAIEELTGDEIVAAEPLLVGRKLVALVMETPGWVRRTTSLSAAARKVRDLAMSAHDPNKFMLDDIPSLVGASGRPEQVASVLKDGLREISSAYPDMLAALEKELLRELRVQGKQGLANLRARAEQVTGITGNFRLDAFATRLASYDGSIDVLEGLASLAANKPPRDWVDRDVDAARIELAALARDFLRAEGLAHVAGREQSRFALAIFMSDPQSAGVIRPEVELDASGLAQARAIASRLREEITEGVSWDVAIAAAAELASLLANENMKLASKEPMPISPIAAAGGA